jgi:lysophospholipase L1-like esterase
MALFWAVVLSSAQASRLVDNLQAGKDQTIVVYGTSLTEKGAWVGQLEEWLNSQGWRGRATILNKGLSGSTTKTHGIVNVERDVISSGADGVFIEFGMNDCIQRLAEPDAKPPRLTDAPISVPLDTFRENLESIILRIKEGLPEAELFLLTMNPAADSAQTPNSGRFRSALPEYYQAVRDVGAAHSVRVIDTHADWLALQQSAPEKLKSHIPDGVHPVPSGCAAITTPAIQAALTKSDDNP